MLRNYLSGELGDGMNNLLAAAGFNMKKMLNRLKAQSISFILYFYLRIFQFLSRFISDGFVKIGLYQV